ncbi:hypothetical protein BSZ35_16045 [Salinibacter sp. 10B]|uniref:beta strand repeat-containing protein n=1 Tax=Salinibacter sp. 10B TaxID=1923971 RepID=UPI000CF4234B|nr:CSLREA domain-containing protein [Salinibacter sp. 10B]PQJ35912.1 hypothetical protein BSZ35_16045 [Salinibacter sp. 10B]
MDVLSAPHSIFSSLSTVGGVVGLLLISFLGPDATQAQDQTFMVNSTADASDANPGDGTCATSGGACTLRAAIEEANSDDTRDKIDFSNIPTTSGFATISLNSQLQVVREINIAGETAPGYPSSVVDGPIVKLDGSNMSSSTENGIEFSNDAGGTSAESVLEGLAITNMPSSGIFVGGPASKITIRNCFLGVDVDGKTVQGNDLWGVILAGGGAVFFGNLVSGNGNDGITVSSANNQVINNIVGLDHDGDAAKGNAGNGIAVFGDGNQIGYATVNPIRSGIVDNGNVISANGESGIDIRGDENAVAANNIGTNADGSTVTGTGSNPLGNDGSGVTIAGTGSGSHPAQRNVIGDDDVPEDRNLVSGNDGNGITLGDDQNDYAAVDDTLRNNVIGLNASRDAALPNGDGSSTIGGIVGSYVTGAVIDSNRVSGNDGQGIIIFSAGGYNEDLHIVDNLVGTNHSFATGLGNAYDGIQVKPNPSGNLAEIEVTENIIGNNSNDGVDIRGGYHDVANNFIGVAPDGSDIGNGSQGVIADNGGSRMEDVFIGSGASVPGNGRAAGNFTPTGVGNVIGYNGADGILFRGQASGVEIGQNFVGTNPSGTDIGNGSGGGDGIRIVGSGNAVSDITLGYNEGEAFSDPFPADGQSTTRKVTVAR